ncbi:MAG: hypothetical protein KKC80_00670 [Candidatus Margulisbacteria bacterium]|nr:hypothetical protein [Candidatus Margulisiibacteriota bacterium]MBU1616640.1 hypothetical protein [Candidatus Margulisiibacteriota bacterium]
MKRVLLIVALYIACLSTISSADIILSRPILANKYLNKIEAGSTPKIIVSYRNETGKKVELSSVAFYLEYDSSIIDNITKIDNLNTNNFIEKEVDLTKPGLIVYKLESIYSNWNLLPVRPSETVDLAEIFVHINQDYQTQDKKVDILNFSQIYPSYCIDDILSVTGALAKGEQVVVAGSTPPEFNGLNLAESANIMGVGNPGNTVVLDWISSANNTIDFSKYENGKLTYRVFRASDPAFSNPVDLSVDATPPYTGNISGKDYIYQDGVGTGVPAEGESLSDGSYYYYKVCALDNTSPVQNESVNNKVLSVVPMDLNPPGEVENISAEPDDRKITLTWKNPTDPDFGGIVILKNTGRPIGNKPLISAAFPDKNGQLYTEGEEPFGPGNGKIAYVSPQEDVDPSLVLNGVEDYVDNGVVNYYRIITYDRAITGPPREMGRNYSAGVNISKTAGKRPRPITDFKVIQGAAPGEVSFSWKNSSDDYVEGIIVRYSTDLDAKYDDLNDETIGEIAGVFPLTAGPGEKETVVTYLPLGSHYYFKAYAYNITANPLDPFDPRNMSEHIFALGATADLPLPIHLLKQDKLAVFGQLQQEIWAALLSVGYIDGSGAIQPIFDGNKENFYLPIDQDDAIISQVFDLLYQASTEQGEIIYSAKTAGAKEKSVGEAKIQIWIGNRLYQKELATKGEGFIVEPAAEVKLKVSSTGMVALSSNLEDYLVQVDPGKQSSQSMGMIPDNRGKMTSMGTGKVGSFAVRASLSKNLEPGSHTILVTAKKIEADGSVVNITEAATVEIAGGPLRVTKLPLAYPSPFSAPRDKQVTIQYGLSASANVEIYLIGGDGTRIKHFIFNAGDEGGAAGINKIVWNGQTDQGYLTGNGIYVGTILSKDEGRLLSKFKLTVAN